VRIHGKSVPVLAAAARPDLQERLDDVLNAVPFRDWAADMDEGLIIHSVTVNDVDYFGPRVGFIKFTADAEFHGHRVPGIVFMRGGAVAILVVLRCEGERWVLCCRQPRVPAGKAAFLEIPAGMLDGSGKFAGVAAKVCVCVWGGAGGRWGVRACATRRCYGFQLCVCARMSSSFVCFQTACVATPPYVPRKFTRRQ
jgi:hypothetical protein